MISQIRILITEDHLLVAKLLMSELNAEPSFHVVDIMHGGKETIEFLEKTEVDVLLLDIYMNKIDGMAVLKLIRNLYPDLKIIMLTSATEGKTIKLAVEMGANGFVTKQADIGEIRKAIYSVVSGETFFCKISFNNFMKNMKSGKNGKAYSYTNENEVLLGNNGNKDTNLNIYDNKLENVNINPNNAADALEVLTPREREILDLIIQENTTKAISEKLFISCRTVETHRKNILTKLGIKNSLCLMKFMIANHSIVA
jgi:DNA-binding NarL/FixJ family response regulator